MIEKKIWVVVLTNQEEWDSPYVIHVKAETKDEAEEKALKSIGMTEDDFHNDEFATDISSYEFKQSDIIE